MRKLTVFVAVITLVTAAALAMGGKSPFEKEIEDFCDRFKNAVLTEEPGTREFFSGRFQDRYGIAVTQAVFFNQQKGLRVRTPGEIPDKILLPKCKFEFLRAPADTVAVEVFNNGEKDQPPLPTLRMLHLKQEDGRWVIDTWEKRD